MQYRLKLGLAILFTISMTCSVRAMDSEDAVTEKATASTSQSRKRSNQEDYTSPDNQLEASSQNQEDSKQDLRKVAKVAAFTSIELPLNVDTTRGFTASAFPLSRADEHWLGMYNPTSSSTKKQKDGDVFP